jgi:hypothetical protein
MFSVTPQSTRRKIILLYVALAALISVLCGAMSHVSRFWRLSQGHSVAIGSIVSLQCWKHREFVYQFHVSGASYTGTGTAAEDCDQLTVGAPVRIAFDADVPSINSNGEPRTELENGLIVTGLASLFIPLVIVVAWHRRKNRSSMPL